MVLKRLKSMTLRQNSWTSVQKIWTSQYTRKLNHTLGLYDLVYDIRHTRNDLRRKELAEHHATLRHVNIHSQCANHFIKLDMSSQIWAYLFQNAHYWKSCFKPMTTSIMAMTQDAEKMEAKEKQRNIFIHLFGCWQFQMHAECQYANGYSQCMHTVTTTVQMLSTADNLQHV